MPTKLKSNYQGELLGIPFATNQYGFRDEEAFAQVPPPENSEFFHWGTR